MESKASMSLLINRGGITSADDLDKWGSKNIPGYLGVIEKKQLAKMPFVHGRSWIINMDDRAGTHWVAMRVSDKKHAVLYIDSFGMPPEDIVIQAAWKHKLPIWYTDTDYQGLHEENCGQRALHVLKSLSERPSDWDYFKTL